MHILCGLFGHKHKIMLGTRSKSSDHLKYCFRADHRCSRYGNIVNKEVPHKFVESRTEDWLLLESFGTFCKSSQMYTRGEYEIPITCWQCGKVGKPIKDKRDFRWSARSILVITRRAML